MVKWKLTPHSWRVWPLLMVKSASVCFNFERLAGFQRMLIVSELFITLLFVHLLVHTFTDELSLSEVEDNLSTCSSVEPGYNFRLTKGLWTRSTLDYPTAFKTKCISFAAGVHECGYLIGTSALSSTCWFIHFGALCHQCELRLP